MFENLSYEQIKEMEKAKFKVTNFAENIEIELTEVSPAPGSEDYESFTLLFTSPPEFFLDQSLYNIASERFGSGEIFIVPIQKTNENYVYQAVFNRLRKQTGV